METLTYILPDFWACALIYGDVSGLSNEDEIAFEAWYKKENLSGGSWVLEEQESFFKKYHDASEFILACECFEYLYIKFI